MIEITSLGQMLSLVNSEAKVTVIDFYADWCGPCQMIKPEYERTSHLYDANLVNFCKCNVDRARECASHFAIRAMPTFVVCVGGETVGRVEGANLGVVQRHIDLALGRARAAAHSASGGRRLGAAPAGGTAAATPLKDAFAEQMLKLKHAAQEHDLITQKDACDVAYKLLWESAAPEHTPAATRHPFGVLLLPYLASEAFSVPATSALFKYVSLLPAPACYEGDLIVNQCLRYIIQLTSACTWEDVELIRLLHAALLALLQVPETQPLVVRSVYFHDESVHTGIGLEQYTVMGALFGVAPYPKGIGMQVEQRSHTEWRYLLKIFPPGEKGQHEQTAYHMQQTVEVLATMNKRLADALLQSRLTRDATMRFFGRALALNEDYQKTMHQRCPLSSRFFMIQLQSVLIEVALPILTRHGGSFAPSTIPASYLLEDAEHSNHRSFVNFGKDIERVSHYDSENPLPTLHHDAEPFKPAAHLFFLAARAITLCATVLIDQHESSARNATHPQAPQNQRDAYTAEKCLCEGLLGGVRLGESRMQYLNGLARWLLAVMGVKDNGELPATPPEEWNYLPQQLVDSVIHAAQMAPINSLYMDNMISLMLVLMGNTQYFPKPHTHALFPAFLVRCLQDRDARHALENHPWYASRIVRACIDCYIAVERCPYERVQVRYDLSHCIKGLLKYDSLCDPVREEFKEKGTVLERFSHMAVAEVNESVDHLIDNLTKMNAMMKEGADLSENATATHAARAGPSGSGGGADGRGQAGANGSRAGAHRATGGAANAAGDRGGANEEGEGEDSEEDENGDGTQTYHQLGVGLRSHIMLFNASMGMFIQLCNQFPRGVSQNLVAQQISQMLARSLIAFAGPNSGKLKIEHAQRYDFQPREILSTLVDCLTRFRRTTNFLRCLCYCGVSLEDIRNAMQMIISRHLVSEELTWKLSEMQAALDGIKQDVDDEETLWDDAPDFALDALLSTPLSQPVALPSDVKDLDDLVYVNRDTIHHLLLSENKHPFTKEYLDEVMVDAFNQRPDVAAHREKLIRSIDEWRNAAKAKRRAEKTAAASGSGSGKASAAVAARAAPSGSAAAPQPHAVTELAAEEEEDTDEVRWC